MGCGKTVVAFLALLEVVDAGYQVLPHLVSFPEISSRL